MKRETVSFRLLEASDLEPLTTFFLGLSAETQRHYNPHPLNRETAEQLCDSAGAGLFVAVAEDGEILAYMILARYIAKSDRARYGDKINPDLCASFAPVVADAYQGRGIGTRMARYVLDSAKRMGLSQVILMGGVQERARHFYERLGFRYTGEFQSDYGLLYDMLIELQGGDDE